MNSIIGLINRDTTIDPTLVRLKEAGVADERIGVLSSPKSKLQLMEFSNLGIILIYIADFLNQLIKGL